MSDKYTVTSVTREDANPSSKSNTLLVDLNAELTPAKLRARVWHLDPGDEMSYHRQEEQEELYVTLNGPGQLRIDDDVVDVSPNAAVLIPPETPRAPVNYTDESHSWLIVGAPAVEDDGIYID